MADTSTTTTDPDTSATIETPPDEASSTESKPVTEPAEKPAVEPVAEPVEPAVTNEGALKELAAPEDEVRQKPISKTVYLPRSKFVKRGITALRDRSVKNIEICTFIDQWITSPSKLTPTSPSRII